MILPDKVVFVHQGALGDFLLAWPALYSLARILPPGRLAYFGPASRRLWTDPIGAARPDPETARGIDRLYGRKSWPRILKDTLLVWAGLSSRPPLPAAPPASFWFLPGLDPMRRISPRKLYLEGLARRGVTLSLDPLEAFARLFARGRSPGDEVLLFPGAGHPAKAWPLVKFLELAEMIAAEGRKPVFVLGPQELEKGDLAGQIGGAWEVRAPQSLGELQDLILTARAVVGGDSGPMHLAGMLNVPVVSVFGPTDPALWAAPGALVLASRQPCAPCAVNARNIACLRPVCLEDIAAAQVLAALGRLPGYAGGP